MGEQIGAKLPPVRRSRQARQADKRRPRPVTRKFADGSSQVVQGTFFGKSKKVPKTAESSRTGPWWDAYRAYLESPEWAALRARVIARDRGICQHCFRPARRQEIHHLTYVRVGHELLEDLVLLCDLCHAKRHQAQELDRRIKQRQNS